MNMIYEEDTLYIDVIGELSKKRIKDIKTRVYGIVDYYKVGNVVLNYDRDSNRNSHFINDFEKEYKEKYSGNFEIK